MWNAIASTPVGLDSCIGPTIQVGDLVADRLNKKDLLGNNDPNLEKILDVLQPLNSKDRKAVAGAYQQLIKTHNTLDSDIKNVFGGNLQTIARLDALFKRQDGATDYAGDLKTNLAKTEETGRRLGQDRLQYFADAFNNPHDSMAHAFYQNLSDQIDHPIAEKALLRTLWKLDSKTISQLKETYAHNYNGASLESDIQNNRHLSQQTKDALAILLTGKDNWRSNTAACLKLSEIALRHPGRLDILQIAMQTSKTVRQALAKAGGIAKINAAFKEDDRQRINAQDYLRWGHTGLASDLAGNAHFYHANPETIAQRIEAAEPGEKQLYRQGFDLQHGDLHTRSPEELEAANYYRSIHDALEESVAWHDADKVQSLENKLLDKKEEYSLSKTIKENEDNLLEQIFGPSKEKATRKVQAFLNLPDNLQRAYRDKPSYRAQIDGIVTKQLHPGLEQDLVRSWLAKVALAKKYTAYSGCLRSAVAEQDLRCVKQRYSAGHRSGI